MMTVYLSWIVGLLKYDIKEILQKKLYDVKKILHHKIFFPFLYYFFLIF